MHWNVRSRRLSNGVEVVRGVSPRYSLLNGVFPKAVKKRRVQDAVELAYDRFSIRWSNPQLPATGCERAWEARVHHHNFPPFPPWEVQRKLQEQVVEGETQLYG